MVVLIASHRSALLLYCSLPSYNFIFTIYHRFLIGFRSGLDGGHSIIFSPVNLSYTKNSRERAMLCINTHFILKL